MEKKKEIEEEIDYKEQIYAIFYFIYAHMYS